MDIRELAKELNTLSPIMINKDKLPLEEIADGKSVVGINAVDIFEYDGEDVCVFTTEQYYAHFSFGGIALKNLVLKLLEKTNLTIEELNVELEKKPLEVIFTRDKTKDGKRDITKIKIV